MGDHQREPARHRPERRGAERERLVHVAAGEGHLGPGLGGPLARGGKLALVRVDAGDDRPAAGELDGQPAAAAADVEDRSRPSGGFQYLGDAERQPGRHTFTIPTPQFHPSWRGRPPS